MTRTKWVNSHLKTSRWTIDDFIRHRCVRSRFVMYGGFRACVTMFCLCIELSPIHLSRFLYIMVSMAPRSMAGACSSVSS